MKILGIDYGKRKIGLAIGQGGLSEPLKVIRVESFEDAIKKVKTEIEQQNPEKVVVGISEGEMGSESKKFEETLHSYFLDLPFDFFDETLTSQDAQRLSREAGISRKKRRALEDAFAASIMLQSYIDENRG